MLTNIEWWGGVTILWMIACAKFVYENVDFKEKFHPIYVSSYIAFPLALVSIVLYFYTLDVAVYQRVYAVLVCVGILAFLTMLFYPEGEGDDETEGKDEGEGESNISAEIIGNILLYFPVVLSYGLGAYKVIYA